MKRISETYSIEEDVGAWNRKSRNLLSLLHDQVARNACSAAVWTQTTDVEGEVNGLMTYDRRVLRVDMEQWQEDIQAIKAAAEEWKGRIWDED
jgi:hypothetical protein